MIYRLARTSILLLLAACATEVIDADGDGSPSTLDCDDNDADQAPGLREICNGKDTNCNGVIDDDALNAPTWFRDRDSDSFGDPEIPRVGCAQPDGFVVDNTDCDDVHAEAYPGADELCDGFDNDCDDEADEDDALDAPTWYIDGDGDDFGDEAVISCSPPDGGVTRPGDCDDERDDIHPQAPELCDGDDNDCDGEVDEDPPDGTELWPDADGDGHGKGEEATRSCVDLEGFASNNADCDDTNDQIAPSLTEVCDGLDNDCDPGSSEDNSISLNHVAYTTMDEALAASSKEDTLHVCAGSWTANLTINHDLTITGHGLREDVIIEPITEGSILTATSGVSLVVHGVTLANAEASQGAAIDAENAASLSVTDSVLHHNLAEGDGGAIYGPRAGTTRLIDVSLHDNLAVDRGGAVFAGVLDAERTRFEANESTTGGAVAVDGGDATFDSASVFFENIAVDGAGLAMLSAHQLSGGEYDSNSASSDGGGVWLEDGSSVLEIDVHDNVAEARGGGVLAAGGTTIERATLTDNLADQGGGIGALASDVEIISCDIQDNVAEQGGGLGVLGATLTISLGTVLRNDATTGGGAWLSSGELISTLNNWGSGSDDNTDEDVIVGSSKYTKYGSAASFTCTSKSGACK